MYQAYEYGEMKRAGSVGVASGLALRGGALADAAHPATTDAKQISRSPRIDGERSATSRMSAERTPERAVRLLVIHPSAYHLRPSRKPAHEAAKRRPSGVWRDHE
jgi:hypothetical protein